MQASRRRAYRPKSGCPSFSWRHGVGGFCPYADAGQTGAGRVLNCGCQILAWQTVAGNQTAPKSVLKKTRAHLKRPNPNKHELELNSNIWKYCSVKNFHRKKKLSNIRGLFSHTQKGSVDVLRARHGDAPFDRPRGRGSRACTGFRIVAVVLTNKSAA